jgi:hypothetical protein
LRRSRPSCIQLFYDGGVARRLMQRETDRIEAEEQTLNELLANSEYQLSDIKDALDDALKLAHNPVKTYLAASKLGRRVLNQIFFTEIRVGPEGEIESATVEKAYAHFIGPRLVRNGSVGSLPGARRGVQKRPNPDPLLCGPRFDRDSNGAPGRIRTCDFCLRRAALYPLSYGRSRAVARRDESRRS